MSTHPVDWRSIEDDEERMKFEALASETTFDRLRELAACPYASVRSNVAMKNKCPVDILERFTKDSCSGVRLIVVNKKKTPLSVIEKMTADSWDKVATRAQKRLADGK